MELVGNDVGKVLIPVYSAAVVNVLNYNVLYLLNNPVACIVEQLKPQLGKVVRKGLALLVGERIVQNNFAQGDADWGNSHSVEFLFHRHNAARANHIFNVELHSI